jgi:hypothetical protein
MPELRKQQRAIEAELQSLEMTTIDQTRNLRLVETLAQFRTRLRARGNVLEVTERQRVVRLLVQEILVGGDNITIRHSIPMPASSPDSNDGVRPSHEPPEPNTGPSYLLRSHGQDAWDNFSELTSSLAMRVPVQPSTHPDVCNVDLGGPTVQRVFDVFEACRLHFPVSV